MPPRKSDITDPAVAEEVQADLAPDAAPDVMTEDTAPHPLPSGGGTFVFEAGELKQVEAPTRDARDAANDPVKGAPK